MVANSIPALILVTLLWNRRWLRVACTHTDISITKFYANWAAYEAAADMQIAAECLERCLAGSAILEPEQRDVLILEAAFFTAWRRSDADKATVWFNRLTHPELVWPLSRVRTEVALSCANRQFGEALNKWEHGLTMIRKLVAGAQSEQHQASWLEWRRQIEELETAAQQPS